MIDRSSLLLTDARLLAEDDRYIVVSLRIPKRALHANLQLLSSAMQASLDRTLRPRVNLAFRVYTAAIVSPLAVTLNWLVTLYLGA